MPESLRFLFAEDQPVDCELAEWNLRSAGLVFESMRVDRKDEFLRALKEFNPHLILSDYAMPQFSGMDALRLTQESGIGVPFLILTGALDEETAVSCLKAGADNYILKDHLQRLPFAVQDALKQHQIRREKEAAEAQLRESEAKFRALFENNHAPMLLIDPANGAIIGANPAASAYYGWSQEEFSRKNIAEINTLSPADVKAEMDKALMEHRNSFEFRLRLASGEIRDVEVFSGPIQHQGKTLLYSIIHDITTRKQSEAAVKRKNMLQEKLAALGRDLASRRDLQEIYAITKSYLQSMVDCPVFGITLFDPEKQMLSAACFIADGKWIDPSTLPPLKYNPEGSASGRSQAIALRKPLIVHDLPARIKAKGGMLVGSDREPETAIYVPILVNDEVVGLLDLQSYQKNAYSPEDGEWLSVVANQLGLSIQNARLFQKAQQRVAELQTLHHIDLAITTSVHSQVMFEKILKEIITQPFVDAVNILQVESASNKLIRVSWQGFRSQAGQISSQPMSEILAGKILTEKKPLYLNRSQIEAADFYNSTHWEEESFTAYFGLPLIFHDEMKGILEIFSRGATSPDQDWMNFMIRLSQQVAIAVDNSQLLAGLQQANNELLQAYDATIAGWSKAMDLRDKETEGHTERVTELTLRIARAFHIPDQQLIHIRRGALLHDIGKLGVPDTILHKPGPLTTDEWMIMKRHPIYAYEMLVAIEYLQPALAIPYCHHEKWDGTGYPRGLKGEQIPLEARIFALVDVFDALSSDRPYRPAWHRNKILNYFQNQKGAHFDPEITNAFLDLTFFAHPWE